MKLNRPEFYACHFYVFHFLTSQERANEIFSWGCFLTVFHTKKQLRLCVFMLEGFRSYDLFIGH